MYFFTSFFPLFSHNINLNSYYFHSAYHILHFRFLSLSLWDCSCHLSLVTPVTVTTQSQLGLLLSLVTPVTVTTQSQLGFLCDPTSLPCHSHLQLSQISHTTPLTSTSLSSPSQTSPHSSFTTPPIYIKFISFCRFSTALQLLLLYHFPFLHYQPSYSSLLGGSIKVHQHPSYQFPHNSSNIHSPLMKLYHQKGL